MLRKPKKYLVVSLVLLVSVAATLSFGIYALGRSQGSCGGVPAASPFARPTGEQREVASGVGRIAVYGPNPRYFQDPAGHPIFLVGPYAFWGSLSVLKGKSNYFRFGLDGMDLSLHWRRHNPWPRVPGSGTTSTGIAGKFDLTKFDDTYFALLRAFIADAQVHGIYVHVSFFNEIFVKYKPKCCGFGRHPFGNGNHINADLIGHVDRDNNLDGRGSTEFYDADALWGRIRDAQRLAVADLQKKYVKKVVLETRDFANVFYEIGNEISASHDWIAYWVSFIRALADNPISVDDTHDRGFNPLTNKAYPVDAATYHTGDVAGDAIRRSMPDNANQYKKILGNDTDGIGRTINRDAEQNRKGAWLTFVGGGGIWADYMDGWNIEPLLDEVEYFGYLLHFIRTTDLQFWEMVPCHALTSKGKLLAKLGEDYLVYSTTGGTFNVDLSEAAGKLYFEWYNPRNGEFLPASTVFGGAQKSFTTPDHQDWVLHISSTPIEARLIPDHVSQDGAVLFHADFEDSNNAEWKPNGGIWGVYQPPYGGKSYYKSTVQENLSITGNDRWNDYTVQALISLANEEGGIGILGRVQNESQYYQLELKKDPETSVKKWWIFKNDRGAWSHIASGDFDFHADTFYLLQLIMRGSVLTAAIATDFGTGHTFTVLGSGTDTSFSAGKIGLRSWGATASFDEVRVLSP